MTTTLLQSHEWTGLGLEELLAQIRRREELIESLKGKVYSTGLESEVQVLREMVRKAGGSSKPTLEPPAGRSPSEPPRRPKLKAV